VLFNYLARRALFVILLFLALLGYGWWTDRLTPRAVLVFVGLFAAGFAGYAFDAIGWWTAVAWIAVLNVALGLKLWLNEPAEPTDLL
jgi:hypothetical protein